MKICSFAQNTRLLLLVLIISKNQPHFVTVSSQSIEILMTMCGLVKTWGCYPLFWLSRKITTLCEGLNPICEKLIKILIKNVRGHRRYSVYFLFVNRIIYRQVYLKHKHCFWDTSDDSNGPTSHLSVIEHFQIIFSLMQWLILR